MPRFATLAATAALTLGVAACGSSSSSSSSSSSRAAAPAGYGGAAASSSSGASSSATTSAAATGRGGPVSVAAAPTGALKFDAAALSAAAGTVHITFTNKAPEVHNLNLQKGTSGPVIGATPTFTGGSRTLTVKLAPGTYTYFCSVPGHRMAGMQGTLTVK